MSYFILKNEWKRYLFLTQVFYLVEDAFTWLVKLDGFLVDSRQHDLRNFVGRLLQQIFFHLSCMGFILKNFVENLDEYVTCVELKLAAKK